MENTEWDYVLRRGSAEGEFVVSSDLLDYPIHFSLHGFVWSGFYILSRSGDNKATPRVYCYGGRTKNEAVTKSELAAKHFIKKFSNKNHFKDFTRSNEGELVSITG